MIIIKLKIAWGYIDRCIQKGIQQNLYESFPYRSAARHVEQKSMRDRISYAYSAPSLRFWGSAALRSIFPAARSRETQL